MLHAFWQGIASIFEFIFKLVEPIGMAVDVFFIIAIAFGCIYWLVYEQKVNKGGTKNYLADKVKTKND
jgi:hypothetical protein